MSSKARDLRRRMSIDPDAPEPVAQSAPPPETPPAEDAPVTSDGEPEVPAPAPDRVGPDPSPPNRSRARGAARRSPQRVAETGWATALDDPAIHPERNGYRSFYVSDAVFARFRAAVFWTARRPDATGVPDNMSAGVEAFMEEVASDLEQRYNDGAVFAPTPDQLRAERRRAQRR